jgi:hypothetical protein
MVALTVIKRVIAIPVGKTIRIGWTNVLIVAWDDTLVFCQGFDVAGIAPTVIKRVIAIPVGKTIRVGWTNEIIVALDDTLVFFQGFDVAGIAPTVVKSVIARPVGKRIRVGWTMVIAICQVTLLKQEKGEWRMGFQQKIIKLYEI